VQADAVNRCNAQLPCDNVAQLVQTSAKVVVDLKDFAARVEESASLRGESEIAPAAFDEGDLEPRFQGADLLTYRALSDLIEGSGLGKLPVSAKSQNTLKVSMYIGGGG
jgi:hypothetical protein